VVTESLFAYIVLVGFFLTLLRAAHNGDRIHRTVLNKWQRSFASHLSDGDTRARVTPSPFIIAN